MHVLTPRPTRSQYPPRTLQLCQLRNGSCTHDSTHSHTHTHTHTRSTPLEFSVIVFLFSLASLWRSLFPLVWYLRCLHKIGKIQGLKIFFWCFWVCKLTHRYIRRKFREMQQISVLFLFPTFVFDTHERTHPSMHTIVFNPVLEQLYGESTHARTL